MINITEQAQKYLKKLLSKQHKYKNFRISIDAPGTAYAECKISYDKFHIVQNQDIEWKYSGFNIYIKKSIIPYLRDSKIDLLGDGVQQKLMLLAPYAINKIDNNSNIKNNFQKDILFNEIQNFIVYNINPMLSMHGGKIILIDITEQGYIMIRFLGGCNGCAMSKVTLKKGIESQILKNFPNIKGVKDITEHTRGSHSFI